VFNQYTATAAAWLELLTDEQADALVTVADRVGDGLVVAVNGSFIVATHPDSIGYVFTARIRPERLGL